MSQMQYESHSLVEISRSEWKTLLELYKHKQLEPNGYGLIKNYIKWVAEDEKVDAKIYSLDGEWQSDGTFVMIVNHGMAFKELSFNTLSDNFKRLTNAMLCVLYEATDAYLLTAYGERLIPVVDALREKCKSILKRTDQTVWYRASKELVASFTAEPPAGIELRRLEVKHASAINEIWPHRSEGSVAFVKSLITHNISVGAYDEQGNLIAWCMRLPSGALGLLRVVDTHKRLGLGSLMVRYLSKKISELGDEVRAPVVTENTPSRKMFEKLGFQQIDHVYWSW
ncbi:PREDICTED: uncharacterized protein LOC108611260 [Drosophila arizonae]|uniref:Uncharacterized protein LOC108611260 n=1 Tax=Drosophila arizonae TaxID=7263 RepID=A0ABM1NWD9_DROAR|nr:PREDICTED: uncharacterized protein LOC108611260 [Drosophila arizonae]